MQTFPAYTAAREAAERVVRELANGSQAAALTATQSRDALAAFERLQGFYQATGRRVSLLAAVSEFAEAAGKLLPGRTLGEAVTGYLRTVANIGRKDIKEAVEEFLRADAPRTKASGRNSPPSTPTTGKSSFANLPARSPTPPSAIWPRNISTRSLARWAISPPRAATTTAPPSGNFSCGPSAKITCPRRIA